MSPTLWKRRRLVGLVAGVVVVVVLSCVAGCTAHRAYRVPHGAVETTIAEITGSPESRPQVESHCVEEHPWFSLGFVEFDDQGELWDRAQLDAVEKTVRAPTSFDSDGVLMVVFVHGWKHNASICDENVACFREVLNGFYNLELLNSIRTGEAPRKVVGIYAGWRGLSITTPLLKNASFYARKATAHRVGRGQLLELLTRLEGLRDELNASGGDTSRLVVVGHSFGGAAVYSAVAQLFQERLSRAVVRPSTDLAPPRVEGFGDLVVLVNPAFEASIYRSIHDLAMSVEAYAPHQRSSLVTVSSDTDAATGKAFPLGRFFATLFAKTRDGEQKRSLKTTLGNYEPFRTHRLEPVRTRGDRSFSLDDLEETTGGRSRGAADCRCSYIRTEVRTLSEIAAVDRIKGQGEPQHDGNFGNFGGSDLQPIDDSIAPYNPFLVISASDEIVTEHNGIYNELFINFLRAFVLEMEARGAVVDGGS